MLLVLAVSSATSKCIQYKGRYIYTSVRSQCNIFLFLGSPWTLDSWIYNMCNQCLLPLNSEFESRSWRSVLDSTLCDKIFSGYSNNKTDRHEITEILLKMALISITQKQTKCSIFTYIVVIDRQQGILITNTLSMVSCLFCKILKTKQSLLNRTIRIAWRPPSKSFKVNFPII